LERFKETLDATLDGVSIFDARRFKYYYVNQGALSQLGYERDELLAKTPFEIKPQFNEKSFRRLLKPLELGEKQSLTLETLQQRKDGSEFPVEVFLQYVAPPLGSSGGAVGGYISIARDITERRRAQEQLILAKETAELEHAKAERANHAKSDFIAGISHELRTPLNAIIGFSKLLLNPRVGPLNEDQTAYTTDVVQSAEHLLQLINDVLDLSKIEAGKMTLDLESFSVHELLEQSLIVVREGASARQLQVSVELGPGVEAMDPILGDARKVKQVMYNLLSNAVKFTSDGGQIDVRATLEPPAIKHIAEAALKKEKETGQKQLFICVRDNGVGIAEEHQKRIFNAFEQVDNSYTRQQQGTGLGLALTRRIVELHGGGIWLHSQEGVGSSFVFSLPVRREEAPNGEIPSVAAASPLQKEGKTKISVARSSNGTSKNGKRPPPVKRPLKEAKL
jgi:PAS domain S-box-containing protein